MRPNREEGYAPARLAPALGLRAGGDGFLIVSQTSFRKEWHHVVLFVAASEIALDRRLA